MNKIITWSMLAIVILAAAALAEEIEVDVTSKRLLNETGAEARTTGNAPEPIMAQGPGTKNKSVNVDAIREELQQRQESMEQEMQNMGTNTQKAYQNQNEVRLAVQALHALGNMTGGIGKNISAIAKEFNNSIQATINAEARIEKKSGLARFFTGGDKEAGEAIAIEVVKNQERIQDIKQLQEQCDCDEAAKQMMQEQIQSMEIEQARLQELAQKEQKKKGILGWLWK